MRSLFYTLACTTVFCVAAPNCAHAQTVCTYTEQNGAVKNCIGVTAVDPSGAPGTLDVEGSVADAAADSGNTVKVGGTIISAANAPASTTGVRMPFTMDGRGQLRVVIGSLGSAGAPVATGTTVGNIAVGLGTQTGTLLGTVNYGWSGTNTIPLAADASGYQSMIRRGAPTLFGQQVSVTTSATLVRSATATRTQIIFSVGAANTCYFGPSTVTTANGFPLQPVAGATLTLDTSAAVYAVCSATTVISYIEVS